METSIFPDKLKDPADDDLKRALGSKLELWNKIKDYVYQQYPNATEDWNYPGKKYGWNFRIKDKKRAIIYFLPRNKFFKVAFVFGQKATDQISVSDIAQNIIDELKAAKVYAEGRGIRISVNSEQDLIDIKKLIDIKIGI